MGTHLRVLSESYPMNANITGLKCFSKLFAALWFGRKLSLGIGNFGVLPNYFLKSTWLLTRQEISRRYADMNGSHTEAGWQS